MSHAAVDRPVSDGALPLGSRTGGRRPAFAPLRWAARQLPAVLAFGLLAGLGLYGHFLDWKLPKFSALSGAPAEEREDWCEEHGVPESQCVECNPTLMPAGPDHGWCSVHGVHNCPLEHPDVAQVKGAPDVLPDDFDRAARGLAMQDRILNNSVCKTYLRRVQFASLEAVKQAGVDVELVERRPISETIVANGEVTYDESRFASLASRVPGTVRRVEKQVGDYVQAGDVLALIDSADVGRAKTEMVQALAEENLRRKTYERLKGLSESGAVAGKQTIEAEAALVESHARVLGAERTIRNLGLNVDVESLRPLSEEELTARLNSLDLPSYLVAQLATEAEAANLVPLRAPMNGRIVARNVVAGEVTDSTRVLFQIADTSQMWLTLQVRAEDAGKVILGQPVKFRAAGIEEEVVGKVSWISTTADSRTRMVSVRADLPNPEERLRSETFGTGRIVLRDEPNAVVVPKEAIHSDGCCQLVFVRDKAYFDSPKSLKVFHVRTVRLGTQDDADAEILAGVLPGEVVVTKGSDVLRSQLLKNNLGEGCTCGQ